MKETTTNGTINYPERAKQLISFKGLIDDDKMCPTDLDGCFEYKQYAWIFFETKYSGAELGQGQRITLQEFINDAVANGKHALAIVADHDVEDVNEQVDLKDCIIREVKYDKKPWQTCKRKMKVKEMTDAFIRTMDLEMAENGIFRGMTL